jgi:hypothetical protein
MKKIYSSQSPMMVAFIRDILACEGIYCIVKNELLCGAVGELPPIECWPELWVADDTQYELARELVKAALNARESSARAWRCLRCGESLEGQFAQCWKCGQLRRAAPEE